MADFTRSVPAPTERGSGWSLALSSAGYLSSAMHFYAGTERRSVCQQRLRASRVPKPKQQQPQGTRFCQACEKWIVDHPKGGRRHHS